MKETSRQEASQWAYPQVLPIQSMKEDRMEATRWPAEDSDPSNNPKTLIRVNINSKQVSWYRTQTIQLMLVSYQWDLLTKRTLREKAIRAEIIIKLSMAWYKTDKCNLEMDPKMPGNLLTLLQSRMIFQDPNKIKVLCSSHAVTRLKIWFLDLLLNLRFPDHLLHKEIATPRQLVVAPDLLEHLITSRINSTQFMEEAWASKETVKPSIIMVNQQMQKESLLRFSKTSTTEETPSTIKMFNICIF